MQFFKKISVNLKNNSKYTAASIIFGVVGGLLIGISREPEDVMKGNPTELYIGLALMGVAVGCFIYAALHHQSPIDEQTVLLQEGEDNVPPIKDLTAKGFHPDGEGGILTPRSTQAESGAGTPAYQTTTLN